MIKNTFKAIFLLLLTTTTISAADVVLNNFESGSPTTIMRSGWGGSYANVSNPVSSGINTTTMSAKVGRTTSLFYEAMEFTTANTYSVPASTKRYIHIMVNCAYQALVKIQVNKAAPYITATNTYTANGTWQDLIFEVTGAVTTGTTISSLYVFCDIGNGAPAATFIGALDNSTKFIYVDEIIANNIPYARGNMLTVNNLYDFESGTTSNITGITTYANVDNPVTYPVSNPFKTATNMSMNVGKRTLIGTPVWYAGFGFSFANPVLVDNSHKYLHIMMTAPVAGQLVSFDVKQGATKMIADGTATITTANTWQDVVLDLSTMDYVSSMNIKCGNSLSTAIGDYYFDEIYIDGNSTPRTNISTINVTAANTNISSYSVVGSTNISVSSVGGLFINQNTTVNSITVAAGGKLNISNGVTLNGTVVLENSTDGSTATMIDDYATPTKVIAMKQYIPNADRNWYMCAPIAAPDYTILNKGTKVVEFNEATKAWDDVLSGTLVAGKGYIQVASPTANGSTGDVSFNGTANSGDVSVALSRTESGITRGFNLVGNPYPSYLDWSKVIADGENANIGTTFWYRTKNTIGGYTFATHNGTSGETITGTATTTITKFIPPMQAFWVRVNANSGPSTYSTSMKFKNAMRDHRDENGNTMKAPKMNERKRVRLMVSNAVQTDETIVYFDLDAQDTFDNYDSPKMSNNAASQPEIYTQIGTEKLAINGLNALTDNLEIPLGFVSGQANYFSISAVELKNFELGTQIILRDKLLNTQLVLDGITPYEFSSEITPASTDRFSLLFRVPSTVTSTEKNNENNTSVFVTKENDIAIYTNKITTYKIYNSLGQTVTSGFTMNNKTVVNGRNLKGVFVVNVGEVTKKVIIN